MGWSEYRNGKWTQKQLSTDSTVSTEDTDLPPAIQEYRVHPRGDVGDSSHH